MFISHSFGEQKCNTHDEIRVTLRLRNENNLNEFWISFDKDFDKKHPHIAILVKGCNANVHYFCEESMFLAINNAPISTKDMEIFIGEHYTLPGYSLIPLDDVIVAVLQFYDTRERPNNLSWDEL